jgi:hypothetical protein
MGTKKVRWVVLAVFLGVVGLVLCLSAPEIGRAEDVEGAQMRGQWAGGASMLAAPGPPRDGGVRSVTGSGVEMPGQCYLNNTANQTFCFVVNNGSADGEWVKQVTLTFPAAAGNWIVNSCGYMDPTDSVGYVVNFNCTVAPGGVVNRVVYSSADGDGNGEITNGASWEACVDVSVPSGYSGPRMVPWVLDGDATPTPSQESGSITLEECGAVMVYPEAIEVQGCNGVEQTLTFEVRNYYAGNNETVDISYPVYGDATFTGPDSFTMSNGETVTFTAQFTPGRCLWEDDVVTAELVVEGEQPGSENDSSWITHTVTAFSGWRTQPYTSPVPSMDSAVVWASEDDGGVWVIGGYGSDGATQRYNPQDGTWQTFQSEAVITPLIEYPMDGCYGLNGEGHEVVVLFPDTLVTDSLHIYDITANQWYTDPIPGFFPGEYEGLWGVDVVSLLNNPSVKPGVERNACYLSGGADQPGGGRERNLYLYHPDGTPYPGRHLGKFYLAPQPEAWFNFHASWYVPWVGEQGAICVAGGVDHNHQINHHSQCFDLATETFNDVDGDLGALPEPWWGMADGWHMNYGEYQIWMANGVAQDGTLLPISVYASETSGGFQAGPDVPIPMYRGEGTGHPKGFFVLDGSKGGFWYSHSNLLLAQCPWCHEIDLPLILRGD